MASLIAWKHPFLQSDFAVFCYLAAQVEKVTVAFEEKVTRVTDVEKNEDVGFTFSLGKYGYRILLVQ